VQTPDGAGQSQSAVTFTLAGYLRGARASLPMQIGQIPFALVAGVTAQVHGLSLLESTMMAGIVFAGSAQLLTLAAWTSPVSVVAASLTALLVNLRFILMGPLLAPWLDHLRGWRRWVPLYFLVEHDWALSLKEIERGGRDAAYFFGAGSLLWAMWVVCSIAGFLLGQAIAPKPGHPLFFAAVAVFITLLVPMWKGQRDIVPWLVAAITAVTVSRLLPGTAWHVLSGAIAGGAAGFLRDRLVRR
jgi:predicted branched-subunit amino acid permease